MDDNVVLSRTMSLLNDSEIIQHVQKFNMISPFINSTVSGPDHLSYGLSSSSYEVRIEPVFRLFKQNFDKLIDPLNFNEQCFDEIHNDELIMPPLSFLLCVTVERFIVPDSISIICLGKSTYARCGIIVNPTMINPGTHGKIVIELSNTSSTPVKIRSGNNGIAKFAFFKSDPCISTYGGVYQNQDNIRLASSGTHKN